MAIFVAMLPGLAHAAGEADVVLKFSGNDKIFLYVSLGLGIFALIYGLGYIRSGVMAQSTGTDNMREVGKAIKEGALAYLKQQIQTMLIFVVIIAVGLGALFGNPLISLTFVLGVAASYIAGYAGMIMAVEGNMRTAAAALTSYKRTLETAFRSGAVAGMVTVGMGLCGATLIFLFGGDKAMTLLVGFGFGGSLAALFMRVGGGIFTKAADVGADLVGKVEAGIPEDDARNPATIADNVGDNVGDCAGMAADVFESYEVTLVAAIVLGAATASIFDTSTWMKLIIFALLARGIGIIASIIGIEMVKGDDDIDKDPLKAISRGFYVSAVLAGLATVGLAFTMMGGKPDGLIKVSRFETFQDLALKRSREILNIKESIATTSKKEPYKVTAKELLGDSRIKAMGFTDKDEQLLASIRPVPDGAEATLPSTNGYQKVDLTDASNPVLAYTVQNPMPTKPEEQFVTIGDLFNKKIPKNQVVMVKVKQKIHRDAKPAVGQTPAQPPMDQDQDVWTGPVVEGDLDKGIADMLERAKAQKDLQVALTKTVVAPLTLYANKEGKLLLAFDHVDAKPEELSQSIRPLTYFKSSLKDVKDAMASQQGGAAPALPDSQQTLLAETTTVTVPWFMFAACIIFGLFMAVAIERLTDYYVSTHKKPVREVAGVSTAGAAPMIIQGFAYACESSVFMVLAIVVALLMPLFFFPPTQYGSYILSFYGIALVGLGLLTTTGFVLAMDTFGPISDNAQGVYEMSGDGHDNEYGSKAVQRLDAAGNTTKALTKGFAIATAVVAAVALFHSYLEAAHLETLGLRLDLPEIFLGLLIGGAAPYLFSATTINAVGRAAFELINEVRKQFREDSGILAGTSKPNYARCVAIVTAAAQRELLGPAILAIFLPVAVAFGFSIGKEQTVIAGHHYNLVGAQALGGFLAGAILSGQLMAVLLANSGGMWDNAKKLIEDGLFGGKGSEAHKAAVVCDTVGDPFKDTAGPAMNPLIKVMNLVGLLFAPVFIQPLENGVLALITALCVAILAFSIWWSKRGSLSQSMTEAATVEPVTAQVSAIEDKPAPAPKRKIVVEEPESTGESSDEPKA